MFESRDNLKEKSWEMEGQDAINIFSSTHGLLCLKLRPDIWSSSPWEQITWFYLSSVELGLLNLLLINQLKHSVSSKVHNYFMSITIKFLIWTKQTLLHNALLLNGVKVLIPCHWYVLLIKIHVQHESINVFVIINP